MPYLGRTDVLTQKRPVHNAQAFFIVHSAAVLALVAGLIAALVLVTGLVDALVLLLIAVLALVLVGLVGVHFFTSFLECETILPDTTPNIRI